MIDVTAGDCLTLCQAARLLPPGRSGRRCHVSSLVRWIVEGATAPDGSRVRLDAVRFAGRWITTREAIARFCAALTPRLDADDPPQQAPPRTPSQRQRASDRAARQLADIGI